MDFKTYLTNLYGLKENFGGIKFSFKDNSIEKSYQEYHKIQEKKKSIVFYVFSSIASIFFIMMRLHAIKFQGHITIYFNTICMIIQSILFILSFNIYRNSDLVFNIKYTRYFLQCFSIIAYIFLPENEMVKNNVKIIYWVLIFNHVSYFYYIDLDYITFPLIPIINTSAIIYAQIYHNFDKC